MATVAMQKENYSEWVTANLGEKTGMWYAPYLEKMGIYLEMFDIAHGYQDNFFAYQTYAAFMQVYRELTGESKEDVEKILEGAIKHYPKEFVAQKLKWTKAYAKYTHEKGERNSPENFGGIADLGAILRSYLKFLYYDEQPTLIYPKREKKIAAQEGEVDGASNYWVISPGEKARLWYEFISDGTIGLGWDYLGDLHQYNSRMEIEQAIAMQREDGKRPYNDSKAVWDFYRNMQVNDTIYVKAGMKKILGKGVVMDNYYFDETKQAYKHRRKVDWIQTGEWNIRQSLAQKTLTPLSAYPDLVFSIEKTINEEEFDESSMVEREFKLWLAKQVDENGAVLHDKTILSKIYALKDVEKNFQTPIFGEIDAEVLRELKESVLADANYTRYKGIVGSSLDYYIRYLESQPVVEENEAYPLAQFLAEAYLNKEQTTTMLSVLRNKKNVILKGAPGVGKTFIADRLAYAMMEEKDASRVQMIQFHQSYSYEDFIEGFRPKADGEGFELKQGPFVKFARKAMRDPERDYFFIIDEINRGNLSKIFGELLMLIEADKRGKQINLLYSNEKFAVPENLYVIGMMNTADRSLALLDYALRRRFSFIEIEPVFDHPLFRENIQRLDHPDSTLRVIEKVQELNQVIEKELGKGFRIGHSYFVWQATETVARERVKEVVEFEIIPQLFEYWFDNEEKAEQWAQELRSSYAE